ncbi:RNA polymerase sigma factor SigA [Aquisphaera giovannonii]|uniref:RNA polymerase sigma factor SigA n=2 Tax=Aquisphaera giovannonii TaxID=406548 RepID=A0A5B9W2A8_9BACT|nr:RNA polymerase sigma factor SigA [Aquisphaera giovannonii]
MLNADEERSLLERLGECKRKLAAALADVRSVDVPTAADDPHALARYIAIASAGLVDGVTGAQLGAVYRTYMGLRERLAMANVKLVAHVAKRFRDRGIPYGDLLQEGFCGLLEAIDRFDLKHETKLATYATWWIRQSIQQAVAAGAYPVRLTTRHLRQLAQNQHEIDSRSRGADGLPQGEPAETGGEVIRRIHAATRPAVSLDAALERNQGFSLRQAIGSEASDEIDDMDVEETVGRIVHALRPREQEVLSLRFGLGGRPRLSLSQVGEALSVSKERVRQIQDRAIEKLRKIADEEHLARRLALEP